MVNVLQVVRGMNTGGLETVVKSIILNADRTQVSCDCLICDMQKADYEDELRAAQAKVYKIPAPDKAKTAFYRQLYNFFKAHLEYDVVHTHMAFSNGIVALAAKRAGVKVVISHSHGVKLPQEGSIGRIPYEFCMRKTMNQYSNGLIACSKEAGNYLFGERIFDIKGRLFINGIALEKYKFDDKIRQSIRKKMELGSKIVLGTVGSLVPAKNQIQILKIIVHAKRKDLTALIVGDGYLKADLKDYARKNGILDQVIFTGKQSNVIPLLNAMDVFVFPSVSEGFGVALLEAQANGLPCVVSDSIQEEAKVTPNILVAPLAATESEWLRQIEKAVSLGRKSYITDMRQKGMDIRDNCSKLYAWYEELNNESTV